MSASIPSAKIILALALTVASGTLSATNAPSTLNYFLFFPALEQLQVRITSIVVTTNQTLIGNVTLAIENPTSYKGLILSAMYGNFTTTNPNGSIVIPQGVIPTATFQPGPLNPHEPLSFTLPLLGFGNGPRLAVSEIVDKGQPVTYQIGLDLFLETFLERIEPNTSIPYFCTSVGGVPAVCQQIGIAVGPYASGGSGGRSG